VDTGDQAGDKSIVYTVLLNTGDARTGSIQIIAAGATVGTLSISQDGVCALQVNPAGAHFGAGGGSGSFAATHSPGCLSVGLPLMPPDWVHISQSGSTFTYTISPNPGPARSIVLFLGSVSLPPVSGSFSISQDAVDACPPSAFSLSPSSATFDADSGTGSFRVSAPLNCGVGAPISTSTWITVVTLPGSPSLGPESVTYSVTKNKGSWRS